ncbi:MAG: Phenylacetic acid catabolic protein [Planctomycetota bacterium]
MTTQHTPPRISHRDEMSERYFDTLAQMVRSQAYRELAASHAFSYALHFVPNLPFKRKVMGHAVEELEHFEACVAIYNEIGAGDLDVICRDRLENDRPIPFPESFLELGVMQFCYDTASAFHLREYENCSFDPYCRVVGKILEEEEGHEDFGAEIVIDYSRDPANLAATQELFDKWYAVSMRSFGRPGTDGNRFAIESGLKTRDSAAVAQDYTDELKSVMRSCGLVFPTRERLEELGTVTSPKLDLSL